jgi:hypothetical protein
MTRRRVEPGTLHWKLGHRGRILLVLAVVDFAYGYSLIGPSSEALALAATIWRQHYAPLWVWGMGWLITGAIMAVSAFVLRDAIGYAAAIVWKILWSLTTLSSWMFGGVDRGWLGAVTWLVVAAMVWDISGWPEPIRAPEPEGDE